MRSSPWHPKAASRLRSSRGEAPPGNSESRPSKAEGQNESSWSLFYAIRYYIILYFTVVKGKKRDAEELRILEELDKVMMTGVTEKRLTPSHAKHWSP